MRASTKPRVVIMDLDKQQSATNWLARRPAMLPKIMLWNEETDMEALRVFAPQWMVVDTDSRTRMAQELNGFFKRSGLPVVMLVPDSFV